MTNLIPDEAVEAAIDVWFNNLDVLGDGNELMRSALEAALPHLRQSDMALGWQDRAYADGRAAASARIAELEDELLAAQWRAGELTVINKESPND